MDIEGVAAEEAEMGQQMVAVGVDGSPASYTALRWALAHAARIGAQVHAIRRHATCPVLVSPPTMATRRTLTPATVDVPALSPRLSGQLLPQPHGQPAAQGIPAA